MYNNETTIGQVIRDVLSIVPDVIVVNDGSTDGTQAVLDQFITAVTIVNNKKNKGKGYALIQGFKTATIRGFTHVITIDADGQHFASDIPVLLSALKDNPDGIIIGCRNLNEKNMPRRNSFANKFSNFWYKIQTGINLDDTQSGFRLYSLSAINMAWPITCRYEAELELIVLSAWAGKQISAVYVNVYYPSSEERVSHFRPICDFARITILNIVLCVLALIYGYPAMIIRRIKNL